VPLRASGARPPLFCACAGNGSALDYRDLAHALPEDQPVYAFGLPPRRDGEVVPTVEQIATAYVGRIRAIQPRGPYRLCGYSFGGLVVYEMAARLADDGQEVGMVALLDTEHPAYSRTLPAAVRLSFHATYVLDRLGKYGRNLMRGRFDLILHDAFDFLYFNAQRLIWRMIRWTFSGMGRDVPDLIRTDSMLLAGAWRAYRPGAYAGRVLLCNAADRTAEYKADATLGWRTCATGPIDRHIVPGGHTTMMRPPYVRALAERLAPYLGEAEAESALAWPSTSRS